LDCPGVLMVSASLLSVIIGIINSWKMTKAVELMQLVTTPGVTMQEGLAAGLVVSCCDLATKVLEIPRGKLSDTGGKKVTMVLKELCFQKLLEQDVAYAEEEKAGAYGVVSGVDGMIQLLHSSTGTITNFLSHKFPQFLDAVSEFSAGFSMLAIFCPHLLVYFSALALLRVEFYNGLSHVHFWMWSQGHYDYMGPKDRSGETLQNFKAVRAYNRQEAAQQDFSTHLQFQATRGRQMNLGRLLWLTGDVIFEYIDIWTHIYAGSLVILGTIRVSALQELFRQGKEMVWRTMWVFEEMGIITYPWCHGEETWIQAGAKLLVLFERKPPMRLDEGELDASNIGELRGDIELRNVTFRYPTRSKKKEKNATVFENLSLKIAGGTKQGLVGPSGGGKTTVLALIQRFYDCEKGEVLLDGRPLSDYKPSFIARQIGVVQQESAIFDLTVSENIRWGKPDATEQEIEEALMKASLYHDLDRKPLRFETPAGELSGGQKQRLTIARAIVRRPKILLLDEATAALDTKSEREVQKALNTLMADVKGTCIAIAHRLSTIMDSDSIAVIKNKKVVEQGSHRQLVLKEGGIYAELSRLAGMSSDGEPSQGEAGEADAIREAMQLVSAEAERDPGNTLFPKILQKLKAANAYTNTERRHLKELSQTYERALQRYNDDKDATAMQEAVKRGKLHSVWTPTTGSNMAKLALLPPALQRAASSTASPLPDAAGEGDDKTSGKLGPPPAPPSLMRMQTAPL